MPLIIPWRRFLVLYTTTMHAIPVPLRARGVFLFLPFLCFILPPFPLLPHPSKHTLHSLPPELARTLLSPIEDTTRSPCIQPNQSSPPQSIKLLQQVVFLVVEVLTTRASSDIPLCYLHSTRVHYLSFSFFFLILGLIQVRRSA
ncbi:hypothetical protein BDV23DRAFT_23907 [Aspergillus alliaceus]|uniref:Uncharacterized protein n=1 Tax=Petromyces alliaceus TaxID=209559 RepID=A0A5N7CJJ1_PETAA|nr:hypothetical protein BDV23DRAFT_23907 [Aspergillus alliaceus]